MMKKYLSEALLVTKTYNLQDFKDWLFWYKDVIKFDIISVYDNESDEDIESECKKYPNRVRYYKVSGWPNQHQIYQNHVNGKSEAWWVFPVDDDEFLYISDKYNNSINDAIIELQDKMPDMYRLAVGWINLFPKEYIKERKTGLIENATAYSHKACYHWQYGNTYLKTLVKTTRFHDYSALGSIHNPSINKPHEYSNLPSGEHMNRIGRKTPTSINEDLILFHYQFKSDFEWTMKCRQRKSAANRNFNKNHPDYFRRIYQNSNDFKETDKMVKLWRKNKNV